MARPTRKAPFRPVSEAELGLLEALWEEGPASPAELLERARARGARRRAYTTVQTLLHRLHAKGYVSRERRGTASVYAARRSREEVLAQHVDDLARRLCDGLATPLVQSLVRTSRLSADEIARLRRVLAHAEREARGRGPSA